MVNDQGAIVLLEFDFGENGTNHRDFEITFTSTATNVDVGGLAITGCFGPSTVTTPTVPTTVVTTIGE